MATLSVIIPTRDRYEPLRKCLLTLHAQDLATGLMDVTVVDDGSEQPLGPLVDEVAAQGSLSMRWIRQQPSGLNVARNRGIEVSGGAILAFLDDDTLVSPGWGAALIRAFEEDDCDAVGGRVELRLDGPHPAWLETIRGYLAEFDYGSQPRWLDGETLPVGANCAVRRSALENAGRFVPGLDRVGSSLVSNGDTELFSRLLARGGRLRYEPEAHVVHCIPNERLTFDFALRRAFAQGVSDELLLQLRNPTPVLRRRARAIWRCGRTAPIFAKGIFRRRATVNSRLWMSYCGGLWSAISESQAKPDRSRVT